MITIETAIKLANYKITGGAEYQWKCFGPNARFMDFESNPNEVSFSLIFDTVTQEVYEATVCDYTKENCYRIMNPDYTDAYLCEADSRNVNPNQAYDEVEYIDIDVEEDFIEKATAILNGQPYDERVTVAFNLPNDVLFILMKDAHEQDMTFNDYMTDVLERAVADVKLSEKPY